MNIWMAVMYLFCWLFCLGWFLVMLEYSLASFSIIFPATYFFLFYACITYSRRVAFYLGLVIQVMVVSLLHRKGLSFLGIPIVLALTSLSRKYADRGSIFNYLMAGIFITLFYCVIVIGTHNYVFPLGWLLPIKELFAMLLFSTIISASLFIILIRGADIFCETVGIPQFRVASAGFLDKSAGL